MTEESGTRKEGHEGNGARARHSGLIRLDQIGTPLRVSHFFVLFLRSLVFILNCWLSFAILQLVALCENPLLIVLRKINSVCLRVLLIRSDLASSFEYAAFRLLESY